MSRLLKFPFMLIFVPGILFAANPATRESGWTPQMFSAINSNASSTFSVTGVGFSYSIYVSSPSADFGCSYEIQFATSAKMASTGKITYSVVTTSSTAIPANTLYYKTLPIIGENPTFIFQNMVKSSTLYFSLDYGQYRTGN